MKKTALWVTAATLAVLAGIYGLWDHSATPADRAASLLREARYALQRGNNEKALEAFESAAALDLRSFQARMGIATAQTLRRRFAEAVRALREATPLAGVNPEAWASLARGFRHARATQEAVSAYGTAVDLAPDRTDLLIELADLYSSGGADDEALAAYRRAELDHADRADLHAGVGRIHIRQGTLDSAAARFGRALREDPGNPDLLAERAQVDLRLGFPERAVPGLRQALDREPYHLHARYLLGRALLKLGRQEEAKGELATFERYRRIVDQIQSLEESGAEHPTAEAYHTLSHLYARVGQDSLSEHTFKRATELDPMVTAQEAINRLNTY